MATERRILRLQQLILELAAETIQREARNPLLDLVSITRVKLTNDLSSALLYWSSLDTEKGREKVEEAIEGIRPLVQKRVGNGLRIRLTPRLAFQFDPTLEHAQRLETIFHKLQEERGDEPEEGEDEQMSEPTQE